MSITSKLFSPVAQEAQRKAIYAGLTSILTEVEANEALERWASYFSETGSVFNGLNNFARDICIRFDKNDQQRELVRALNRALIIRDSIIKDKPVNSKDAAPTSAELAVTEEISSYVDQRINTPDFQTFKYLFSNIINMIEKINSPANVALKPFLSELIESMTWSEAQQQMMIMVDTGSTNQVRSYRPDQLKTFLSHMRTWMTDELGDADTIRILKQAVKDTEKMPAGTDYSPKNFV